MIKVGIAVFAYNRSKHLGQVLGGLKKNSDVTKIYVFQDGLKQEEHREEWEKTQKVIESITWCTKEYYVATYNKGLAQSIVDGINIVFEKNDAVIVLEDDCVPSSNFIRYMNKCFEKYEHNEEIYSVSGYAWPINVKVDESIYFCGRFSSWGWGTWKNRWKEYQRDYESIRRIQKNLDASKRLREWGNDLERMLISNLCGDIDSWAVFWALHIIEKGGLCVNPIISLIQNIGFDNTGVHCKKTGCFDVEVTNTNFFDDLEFPKKIEVKEEVIQQFSDLYGGGMGCMDGRTGPLILIYGVGAFCKKNEPQLYGQNNVLAYIDKRKSGFRYGLKIIKPGEIKEYNFDYIYVMLLDSDECEKVRQCLTTQYGIENSKIIYGKDYYSF